MRNRRTAIVILNYNSWQLTIDIIENQLSKVRMPEGSCIVIVDNCSSNESVAELKKRFSNKVNCKVLTSGKNGGYASGNNIGLRWAHEHGYKYGWILNNDILLPEDNILKEMIGVFECDSAIGVVSPKVFTPSGMETNRNLFRPSVFDLTFGKIRFRRLGRTIPDSLRGRKESYCYNYRSQGCCMLVDLDVMHDVDYMDEHTFLYMEEPILAERLLLKDYKEACALNTKVIHAHSTTVASAAKRKQIYKWQNDSEIYYYKQYRRFNGFQIWLCTSFTWLYYWLIGSMKRFN
jgi:GT2 family glycosyltransferase